MIKEITSLSPYVYCAFFNAHARNWLISTSGLKSDVRHHRVPRPRFPIRRENSGDSRSFKAEIGTFMFAWISRTFWPQMTVFGGKIGK